MARKQSWNAPKLTAELSAADEAINPLLTAANITSIKIDGADKPASDVPLDARINAYASVMKAGAKSNDDVELATLNGQITAQLEKSESALAVAKASLGTITQEKSTLETNLSVAQANVTRLTAENAQLTELRNSAAAEAGRVAGQLNAVNAEVSRQALTFNCLSDLRDEKGGLLPSTATAAEKQAAAERIPVADKFKAIGGAVNAAVQRTQVSLADLPSAGAGTATAAKTEKTGRARFSAAVAVKQ